MVSGEIFKELTKFICNTVPRTDKDTRLESRCAKYIMNWSHNDRKVANHSMTQDIKWYIDIIWST